MYKPLTDKQREHIDRIAVFVRAINYYQYEDPKGIHNNKEFWEVFHDFVGPSTDSWLEMEEIFHYEFPHAFSDYPYVNAGTDHLKKCRMFGKPLTKRDVPSKNKSTFRAWANIKDVINSISDYTPPPPQVRRETTPFEDLFE